MRRTWHLQGQGSVFQSSAHSSHNCQPSFIPAQLMQRSYAAPAHCLSQTCTCTTIMNPSYSGGRRRRRVVGPAAAAARPCFSPGATIGRRRRPVAADPADPVRQFPRRGRCGGVRSRPDARGDLRHHRTATAAVPPPSPPPPRCRPGAGRPPGKKVSRMSPPPARLCSTAL